MSIELSKLISPNALPQHIAIIMDGNRRWAKNRFLPASLGHAAGAKQVREVVKTCAEMGVPYLSLFAFSTENWKRPEDEVSSLMGLFMSYLQKEVDSMNGNGVRLKVVGDTSRFAPVLQDLIAKAERETASNTKITLTICANYGGRWDMVQAVKAWQKAHPEQSLQSLTEEALSHYLSTHDAPEVDLLIRTGGESRVSNFLLWQAAYAELFFTDDLWPDFSKQRLQEAVEWFSGRDRRFGSSAPL
ncbi:polyprenyl diphosphate synthase [Limnohabitans sp. 15K]|uniref:polyprenyl diphosphate synthase n=1 Tax=Limnohabitans sp. 15K TaxID=1100706 RepID=UPI000C1E3FC5|nr:polyprenyl diphosphate synthase [Limnohabitans sp. 15K]PIT81608.1 di-trans,poly-cis-decaprenylcistransferase [Limnohabitans sp. 15K]